MHGSDATPDDVPIEVPADDAAEQLQPGSADDTDTMVPSDAPPLESDPADWQEQQRIVEGSDEDEHR